jgi:hypothetical protein
MYLSRVGIIFGLIILILLLGGKIGFDTVQNYANSQRCLKPETATRAYGYLPPLNFPSNPSVSRPLNYTLALGGQPSTDKNGNPALPSLSPKDMTVRVYQVESPVSSLQAEAKVKQIATTFGFTLDPEIIDANNYRYQSGSDILEINKQTLNLKYQSNFLNNNELHNQPGKTLPTNGEATALVKGVLSGVNLLPADVASPSAKVTPVKVVGNSLVESGSVAEADFLEVVLYRMPLIKEALDEKCQPIEQSYEYFSPEGVGSEIHAIVARNWTSQDVVVALTDNYHQLSRDNFAVYNTRSLFSAWNALISGEAYIASSGINADTAVITNIQLGYFVGGESAYVQPVFVFTGSGGFEAYVSAVSESEIRPN